MDNAQYLIVIDQDYCPHSLCSKKVCTIFWLESYALDPTHSFIDLSFFIDKYL